MILMFNHIKLQLDEYTIDSDYTTHRQMSVPANGYIPVASQGDSGLMQGQVASMSAIQQTGGQPGMYQNRQIPQPQVNVIVATTASNNPFGNPAISGTGQDNRSLAGSHVMRFLICQYFPALILHSLIVPLFLFRL